MLDLAAKAVAAAAAAAFTAVVTSQGLQEHGLLNPTLLREVTSLLYTHRSYVFSQPVVVFPPLLTSYNFVFGSGY